MKKILLISAALLSLACSKNEGPNGGNGEDTSKTCSVSGYAQKGPLSKGSQVTAFAVGKDLVATGESFPANISDDRGAFTVSGETSAPYLELRADGYYFNEISGSVSTGPLYLEAFVESADRAANLNLMTTAIKQRVKSLIKSGKAYAEASKQAQSELLSAMGITASTENFDEMDITKGTESDAILLAFACMMQNGRDAGGVTTLIQEVASELDNYGTLPASLVQKITSGKENIDILKVIENICRFYEEKNINDALIPQFYGVLNEDLNSDFVIYSSIGDIMVDVPGVVNTSFSGTINILSQIEFESTTDCDWIEVTPKNIGGPAYSVRYYGRDNTTDEQRVGHIIFKDKSGNVLESIEYSQDKYVAPKCTLRLNFGDNTRASLINTNIPSVGDKILVNTELCEVSEMEGTTAIVEVSPNPILYRASWPADNMGFNENPAYVVKTFPSEVAPDASGQFYGGLKLSDPNEAYGTHSIDMTPCTGVIQFSVENYPQASYIILKGGSDDDFFSGTASYVWRLSDLNLDPTLVRYYGFENKSNQVKIRDLDTTGYNYVSVMPQSLLSGFTLTIYDASGNVLAEKQRTSAVELGYGKTLTLQLN